MAKNDNYIGIAMGLDVTDLKAGISEANKQIKEANSKFKAAASGMDNWQKSTDGLKAKITQLESVMSAQESKLNGLRAEYEKVAKEQGENSDAARDLRIQLNNQEAALNSTKKELSNYQKTLEDAENGAIDLENVVLKAGKAYEKSGGQAKSAGSDIEKAGDQADEAGDKAEDSAEGFTVLKGAFASLVADGIKAASQTLKDFIVDTDSATSNFAAKTGISGEALTKFEDQINDLYKNNYGESLNDVADAMAAVAQNSKETDPSKLKELTKHAITVRDTFGYEISGQMRAVNMLMDQFGITGTEAYNLIVQGAQNGLDKNGDLLDTINEYGVHYKQLGYDADGFFNSLMNGTEAGTFSVDKLGDAMKEFGIRVKDNSKSSIEAFDTIGVSAEDIGKQFAAGGETAQEAMKETLDALFAVEDDVERNAAGVALFGTMWEDLGEDAIKALTKTDGKIKKTEKKMEELNEVKYSDVGSELQSIGREITTEVFTPLAKKAIPKVKEFLSEIKKSDAIKKFGDFCGTVADEVAWLFQNLHITVPLALGLVGAFKGFAIVSSITGAVKTFTGVFAGLNAVMAANPVGAIVTGISLLATGIATAIAFAEKYPSEAEKEIRAIEEKRDAIIDARDRQRELIAEAGQIAYENVADIDYLSRLKDELYLLVDANGKVKDSDKARVDFILTELKEATGIEVEMIDGVIKGWQELQTEIENTIALERAKIILDANKAVYEDAIKNQGQYLSDLQTADEDYLHARIDLAKLEKRYEEERLAEIARLREQFPDQTEEWLQEEADLYMSFREADYHDERTHLEEKIKITKESYDAAKETVREALETISQYEADSARIASGNADEIEIVNNRVRESYVKNGEQIKLSLEEQLENERIYLETLKTLRDEGNQDITDSQIKASEERIKTLEGELKGATETVIAKQPDYMKVWEDMSNFGLSSFAKNATGYTSAGQTMLRNARTGITTESPFYNAMLEWVAQGGVNVFEENSDATDAGENVVTTAESGAKTESSSFYTLMSNIGKTSTAKFSVAADGEKAGKSVVDGIGKGVDDNKETLLGKITSIGKSMFESFMAAISSSSPSKLFASGGETIPWGVAVGVEKNADMALDSVTKLGEDMFSAFDFSPVASGISSKVNSIKSGITTATTATKTANGGRGGNSARGGAVVDARMTVNYNGNLSRKDLKRIENNHYTTVKNKLKAEGAI